jgi:hypothetical protein
MTHVSADVENALSLDRIRHALDAETVGRPTGGARVE